LFSFLELQLGLVGISGVKVMVSVCGSVRIRVVGMKVLEDGCTTSNWTA